MTSPLPCAIYLRVSSRHGNVMTEYLTNDNPKYPPVRPDEARIIGRVYAVTPKTRKL